MSLLDPEMFEHPQGPCEPCAQKLQTFFKASRSPADGMPPAPILCHSCHRKLFEAMKASRQMELFLGQGRVAFVR